MVVIKTYITGSNYFFAGLDDFKSKDCDYLHIVDEAPFKYFRQSKDLNGNCHFEWVMMNKVDLITYHYSITPMAIIKFLNPDFCDFLDIDFSDLSGLMSDMCQKLDNEHKYAAIIWNAYINNNDFTLTNEHRDAAFNEYKKYR